MLSCAAFCWHCKQIPPHNGVPYRCLQSLLSSEELPCMQMDFPTLPGSHRILNVHQNVPGVLKNVNNIIADLNVNIKAQVSILMPVAPSTCVQVSYAWPESRDAMQQALCSDTCLL